MTAFNCVTISSQPTFPGRKLRGERGKKRNKCLQKLLYAKKSHEIRFFSEEKTQLGADYDRILKTQKTHPSSAGEDK